MPERSSPRVRPEDLLRLITVADPQIAPDGRHVAFVRKSFHAKQARTSEIWITTALGAQRSEPLTAGPRDSMPRWSPDGSSLLFVSAKEKAAPQLALLRGTERVTMIAAAAR